MASITLPIPLPVDAPTAWAAVRDVGHPHRLFAGVLTDARLDGDVRTVTFTDGLVVREVIVSVDDDVRRVAYGVIDGMFTHHHASMTVTPEADGSCTLTWVTDVLPDTAAAAVEDRMRSGAAAAATTLRAAAGSAP